MIAWGGRIQNTEFRGQELRTPNPKLRTPTGAEWVETKFRWSRAANMRMYREEGLAYEVTVARCRCGCDRIVCFYGYPYWWEWGYPYYAYDDPYYYPYYYPGSYYGYDAYYGDPNYRTGDNRSYGAKAIQTELARRGYYRGPIDGVLGPESRNAI